MTTTITPTIHPTQVNQTQTNPTSSPVKFAGKNSKDLEKDTLEIQTKAQNTAIDDDDDEEDMEYKEAGTGKKFGVATGSFIIPGLGQAINGQWGKGLGFFAGLIGLGIISYKRIPKLIEANKKIDAPMLVGALILRTVAAVDAWRNAKTKV